MPCPWAGLSGDGLEGCEAGQQPYQQPSETVVMGKRKGWSGVGVAHASNCYALQWLRDSHLGIVGRFPLVGAHLLARRTPVLRGLMHFPLAGGTCLHLPRG